MNRHPEDLIYENKKFISELSKVQDLYFTTLVEELGLNKDGEEWLFDYIYNASDESYESFEHYLEQHGRKYEEFISIKTPLQ